jgi:hypothetical protein
MSADVEEQVEATPEAPPSLRDSITAAMDSVEAAPAADIPAPEKGGDDDGKPAPAKGRDESGRFAPKPKEAAPVQAKPEGTVPVPTSAPKAAPAPQSWTPLAREKWSSLPAEVQAEVARREKETSVALQSAAEHRKYADTMRATLQPFEAHIRAEGSTPERAVQNLMQTALALRTAPPAHKAALVASIISTYNVPLDGLVAALQGKAPPQGQPQQQFDPDALAQQVTQRVAQQLAAQRDQGLAARGAEDVASFMDGRDFAEDLREDMADLIELRAKRGLSMSLEEAYTQAARQHPEISKVLTQREAAEAAAKARASTQRSRVAASSVQSRPSTTPVRDGGPKTIREALSDAFSQHAGDR